ncbi:unnamed protein product [Peniophora sp. CBMAI 1063]|nr:unnamed protein product [Peniophora sp. CBMAI 1063]
MAKEEEITDYLTKELVVNKNIVTYRSLSRALGLHVNVAKNELARYLETYHDTPERACASYMISGEPFPRQRRGYRDDSMDADEEDSEESDLTTEQTRMTLTTEDALEEARSHYTKITSTYVYSLSPAPIHESALICEPAREVRNVDKGKGQEYALLVGRITGAHVKHGPLPKGNPKAATAPPPAPSKSKAPALAKSIPAPAPEPAKPREVEEKSKPAGLKAPGLKAKASGKIDFGKKSEESVAKKPSPPPKEKEIKPKKEVAKKEVKAVKMEDEEEEDEDEPAMKFGPPRGKKKTEPASKPPQRGVKRKSTLQLSDSEDDTPSPSTSKRPTPPPVKPAPSTSKSKAAIRGKKSVVLSSDEEEQVAARKPRKQTAAEKALSAMMDIDDDTVEIVSRHSTRPPPSDTDDVDMGSPEAEETSEDEPVVTKKPARKPRKVVPVGKNGLKKRRIIKSRTAMDDKGFVVTEDYSEYESVDEEEPAPPPAEKKGLKPSTGKKAEKAASIKEDKPAPKKKASAPAPKRVGQSNIQNFFGKK